MTWNFRTTLSKVNEHLGINLNDSGSGSSVSALQLVARQKRVTPNVLQFYGGHEASRGNASVVAFPTYDRHGKAHSHFDILADGSKGMFKTGNGSPNIFLPHVYGNVRLPQPNET